MFGQPPPYRMNTTPRVLPWQDWAEWTETSNLLFSIDIERRVQGVGRVKAWRARGRLPVAVDATAAILEVGLLDVHPNSTNSVRSPTELRYLYSMVLVRAINGLVEGCQTKFYAEPVHAVAARLGIPQWLVDLRHEATHASLPSLSALRMGAQHLLDWLHRGYWEKQGQDLEQAAAAAHGLLLAYRSVALAVQEECPNALDRACRLQREDAGSKELGSERGGIRTASDTHLAEALQALLCSVTPSFLTTFLLPALVCIPHGRVGQDDIVRPSSWGECFLLPDSELEDRASGVTAKCSSTEGCLPVSAELKTLQAIKHRRLYIPLLVRLQRRFPCFARSLFFRLVSPMGGGLKWRGAGGKGPGTESEGARATEAAHFSSSLPAPTFGMWVSYLQSRDWHSHFPYGRAEATFTLRRASGIRFNLRDKASASWTTAESDFMLSRASGGVLRRGLGLGVGSKGRKGREGREGGEGGEGGRGGDEGWTLCQEWIPSPLGGPVMRRGEDSVWTASV
ncbi:las1-like family expressed [Nannochloropsis gaditana]|uniref:Las1-like family expressed n=1 Tax=Nannochloropsis gaditana TaxID=72520 RepID=W7TDD9_9STRA|nr:las1-like family expressed [Nannochloropsis gaditana]